MHIPKWAWRIGIALGLLIAGVLSGFVFLHTPPGRRLAASLAESAASSDNLIVRVEELTGTLPWSPHAKTVTLSDAQGPWLVLHDVTLSWSPLAIISSHFVADQIAVGRLELLRQPAPSASSDDEEGSSFPPLLIERLTVTEASIAPEVAGVAGRFSIEGALDTLDATERSRLMLKVVELAGGAARVDTDIDYEPSKNVLRANLKVSDNAGGTLARMLALPADAPLSVAMQSDGSLDDWKADLTASGGTALKATGAATIKRRDDWRDLKLTFNSDIGAVGPENLRALIQGRTDIEIAAGRSDTDAYRIERATVNAPALKLEASGAFEEATKRAEGIATLSAPSGAAFAPLLADTEWRDLSLTAKLQGAWPTPSLVVDLQATDVKAEGIRSGALTAHGEAMPDRAWNDADATIALTGRADLSDLAADDKTLAGILGAAAILTFKANQHDGKWTGIVGELAATGATFRFAGDAAETIHGVVSLDAPDLSKAGFVRGALSLRANVDANLATDVWAIDGKGQATNAAFGEAIDGLLAGKQDLNFTLEGEDDKIQISSITVQGQGLSFIGSGDIDKDALDLDAKIVAPNASLISAEHAGRVEGDVHIEGTLAAPRINGSASLTAGKLYGRAVKSLAATLGAANDKGLSHLTIDGDYDLRPVTGAADVAWLNGGARVDGLDLTFASVALSGSVAVDNAGLIRGPLKLDAGEIADIAPFIGEDIAGTVAGDLRFAVVNNKQTLTVALAGPHLRVDTLNLANVGLTGSLGDPFGRATSLEARATAASAAVDDFVLEKVFASAQGPLNALAFTLTGNRVDTKLETTATLRLDQKPNVIAVRTLKLTRYDKIATLQAPVDITLRDGHVFIPSARIAAGGGTATIAGDAGRATDLNVTANALPLWVAAFVTDPLPVVGTATGNARIRQGGGTSFDIKVVNLAPESQPRIVRNVTLRATGQSDRNAVTFQLTLADAVRTSFAADGRIPFARDGALSINARGSADLALANAYLSVTGDRARGTMTVSGRITGTRAAPQIEGNGKISDAFFRSAASGFELKDISADFIGSNRRVAVSNLTAKAANGGTVTGNGNIALDPDAGYPINLALNAKNAQLVSTELTTVVADVDARMTGGLLREASIKGTADVSLWEIRLPSRLMRPLTPIRVKHRNAPPHVLASLPSTTPDQPEEEETSVQFGLDVTVRAPRRVFLRGQGIDAEFGGEVKVTNTVDDPKVDGRFDLRRGSVSLLSERVALTSGRVSFFGDVTPTIDVAGEVRRNDFTATVAVKGKASAPEITLSSVPTLPQDEILARVLFNKPTQQLSAFEAAQLAGSIANMSGLASGPGILDRLRNALGIDSLSAVTDKSGGSAVGAGSYIGDDVYFGFVQGTDTTAGRATVDVELTDEVKLRGEAGPSGDTRVGVAAEWEY